MTRPIDIQGHRGARALFPENTLAGFLNAHALGITAFELDVGMTADGVVVVSHDPALNPDLTRDRSGAWLKPPTPTIWSLTHTALQDYDVGRLRPRSPTALRFRHQSPQEGARIPTLSSILEALPNARFTIEVKTHPAHPNRTAPPSVLADALLAVLDTTAAANRVMIESFDWRVQRHVRRARPAIPLAWLTSKATIRDAELWWDATKPAASIPRTVANEGGGTWAPDHHDLTRGQIEEAQALGLRVLPWTVNRPASMRRLIAWGVDGLISDRPDLALLA